MSKKPVSQKRAQRQQQERAALNNIFNTFLVGLIAECYLFIVYRGYIAGTINSLLTWDSILHVLVWVGLAALIGGGVFALVKKGSENLRRIGLITACAGLFFAATSWVMTTFYDVGVLTMCAAVPVLTVLALIFFLYQRECFTATVLLAVTLFTIWVCNRGLIGGWSTLVKVGAVGVVVVIAALCALLVKIRSREGKFFGLQVFAPDCDYRMLFIVAAVSALLVIATLVLPAYSFYLIWAAVIALFAELAFFTTKLM